MALLSTPLNNQNAIESASFVVVFSRGLAKPTFEKVRLALESLSADLPGVGSGEASIRMGGMPHIPGFGIKTPEASRFTAKPDGTPKWQVQAIGNLVQVQCNDYSNFENVWADARRYLLCALSSIDEEIPVGEIGFQVIDKFTHPAGGDLNDYQVTELFNPDSTYLTPKALKSGALWHVHQGWFDPYEGNRILQQLNLSNTTVIATQELHTVIDHRGALRSLRDDSSLDLPPFIKIQDGGLTKLDSLFETLHKQNRGVIEDLLNDDKLKSIGIHRDQ